MDQWMGGWTEKASYSRDKNDKKSEEIIIKRAQISKKVKDKLNGRSTDSFNSIKDEAQEATQFFIQELTFIKENCIHKLEEIFKNKNCSFELMHCISTYPMKDEDANLATITQLKKEYDCNVGYSGHENGVIVSLAAVMLGITSLERHITLDRTMYGSDQAASLEPKGLRELISSIRKVENALGKNKIGHVFPEEKVVADKLRAHLE